MLELTIRLKGIDETGIVLPMVQKMIAEGYTSGIDPNMKSQRVEGSRKGSKERRRSP